VCPTVEWDFDVSSTCNQDGTRDVTVVATVTSSGAPVSAELRDPQGNALDSGTTPATLNSGTLMLAPGIHQFTTVLTKGLPIGCTQEETDTVTVPECEDGPEGCGCSLLRILGLVFLVVGLVLVIGGVCSVVPPIAIFGAVLALIGALLLIWWALCCASVGCRALERLMGSINLLIVAFGVIAAVLAIIAAIAAAAGNPLGLGCAGAAASSAGYLAILNIILWCIFRNRGCVWQADNPFQ